ncbi:MAG: hypothetical protein R3F43_32865 [bacterium]
MCWGFLCGLLLVPELVRRRPRPRARRGRGRLVPTGRELVQMLWVNAAITLSLVLSARPTWPRPAPSSPAW